MNTVREWRSVGPLPSGETDENGRVIPFRQPRRRHTRQAVSLGTVESLREMPSESSDEQRTPGSSRLASTLLIALIVVLGALIGMIVFRFVGSDRGDASMSASSQEAGNVSAGPTVMAGPTVVPTQGPVQAEIKPVDPSHTVQPGDTLGSIARRFNTSVEALQSINNLSDRNALRVGQQLVVP